MTIGIGVLSTSQGRAKGLIPDHAILVADTLGSFGDEYSHPRLHKTFCFEEHGVYAVAANQVDKAAELLPMFMSNVAQVPRMTRTYGDIVRAMGMACYSYKSEVFRQSVLPKFRFPPEAFDPRKVTSEINADLQREWENFSIGCDLIVATFDSNGQAFLFCVDDRGTIENFQYPGFAAVGVGLRNAMFWLSHRQHHLGMSPERAAYHAFEAKMMAEGSPHVNEHIDLTIANAQRHWILSSHKSRRVAEGHPTISLDGLESAYLRYGPRDTDELDGNCR